MNLRFAGLAAALVFSAAAYGDSADERSKLNGTWQIENASGKQAETWTLEKQEDAMHFIRSENNQKDADFKCNMMGRECQVTDSGHGAKVSMWFSGSKLVQLETKGSDVVKRRFAVSGDGNAMDVEIIPVVPAGKPEVLHFKRVQSTVARQ